VNASAAGRFQQVYSSGVLDELSALGLILEARLEPLDTLGIDAFRGARGEVPALVLTQACVPFISYPYEWTFSQLKAAALAHLELQIVAIDHNVALSDSTPFNMQFHEGKAKHIDTLSLRPYVDGEVWAGYNQFCRQFLLPLLLEAWSGVPFQHMLRGQIDGISLADAERLLPAWRRWCSLQGILHVGLHARVERSQTAVRQDVIRTAPRLPKARYRALLTEMREWVASLRSRRAVRTYWDCYATHNTYSEAMRVEKRAFVTRAIKSKNAKMVWDLGGNTGEYSITALDSGADHAVVFDTDLDSLEKAFASTTSGHPSLLPLVIDCADPSPGLGWRQKERKGFGERANADAVLALALTHHLAIGRNIPLRDVIDWIVGLAPSGVIEFVPKSDLMVRQMLSLREDVFHDYDETSFRAYLSSVADTVDEHRFAENDRLLVSFVRKS
jgi:ribosomal protein L11 methylase PrmA